MKVYYKIKRSKHLLHLGQEIKGEHLLKRNYTDGSLTAGNETLSRYYYVANREM